MTMKLIVWLITGAVGVVYFIYGKRQARLALMIAGGALCIYPYFFNNIIVSIIIGVVLVAVPFVIKD